MKTLTRDVRIGVRDGSSYRYYIVVEGGTGLYSKEKGKDERHVTLVGGKSDLLV